MRNQQVTRFSRVSLFAVLLPALALSVAACQDPQPDPTSQVPDSAVGVDADFGVETFALGSPELKIQFDAPDVEPKSYQLDFTNKAPVKVNLTFVVNNFEVGVGKGKIICRIDGKNPVETSTTALAIPDLGQTVGLRTITCNLAQSNGEELTNASARAIRPAYITQLKTSNDPANLCLSAEECADGNECSQDGCVDSKCMYAAWPGCCYSTFSCSPGETCDDPNTAGAKCSTCTDDLGCDDGLPCTVDKCDKSGAKGLCTHTKAPDACCDAADPCDDGKPCTVDSCDLATMKCKHVQPEGACCADSDCLSADICIVGSCVDNECRYNKDVFKPDCCSASTNPQCDDKNTCTIDKCEIVKAGGAWTQCSHVVPEEQKGVCCVSANDCVDGNGCTADVCGPNNKCLNPIIGTCCVAGIDCDDDNLCTADSCVFPDVNAVTGTCLNQKTDPECCISATDCDDNKLCTGDQCNYSINKCVHTPIGIDGCCDSNEECNDGKYCTVDACINHTCLHGPDVSKPLCCEANLECNDANPCTLDTCNTATKTCTFTPNGDGNCCTAHEQCADDDCTTIEYCDQNNQCVTKPDLGACAGDIDCDDNNACTLDLCDKSSGCGACKHEPAPGCCVEDFQCDDSKGTSPNPNAACTADKCVNNKCENTAIAECCIDDADALTACDDDNACTIDYCLNNKCRHTAPKNGCCATAADCFDGDKCTTDTCSNINATTKTGSCTWPLVPGCVCSTELAQQGLDCNDNNVCTADACTGNICTHQAIADCCLDKFDCDDGSPCTYDFCLYNSCIHTETPEGSKLCCTKETEATDCAYLNTECAKGSCQDQVDGSKKCVAQPVPVCTVNIGYCQDFATGDDLKAMGWNPGDVKATAAKNWGLTKAGALGPDQHAVLNWTPTVVNYDTCLQSPIIQAAGAKTITLQYDHEYIHNTGDVALRILGSLDGENVDWTQATVIDVKSPQENFGPETLDVKLPPELTGSNGLRLAFCASGPSTFNLTSYSLDNVCIVKGSKPSFSNCPVNQIQALTKKKLLPIKAVDPDTDAILSFSIVKGPAFVGISSALYYWLDASWNATLTILPTQLADVGTHEVTLKVSDGSLYSLCTFTITVTYEGGYLVWRPSEVPKGMGDSLFTALKKVKPVVQHISDLGLYASLTPFSAVFVSLGVYPDNHVLTDEEAEKLQLYLAGGGRVYLEGGDTWAFDPQTAAHGLFKIQPVNDSTADGITGPLKGEGIYKDITATPVKVYDFEYDQDFSFNNLNDAIAGKAVKRTKNVLKNEGPTETSWVQVGHDSELGYRTVGSSVLFAGVQPSAAGDNADHMMARILHFFDNGFVDCVTAADCDDKNGCTQDTCTAGECLFEDTCTCTGTGTPLACGGAATIVSNGPGSTDTVTTYSCDPNVVYDGNETAIKFTTDASKPVTVKVSNLTNPAARVFVLKASGSECNPKQCIAVGATTLNFAGAKGAEYYLVLDAPGGGSAQADLSVTCGAGEDCSNGLDDNSNSLVDCSDLGSCCGDAACGEVCDGVDNDCDGTIDDGCDDDADGYCDKDMTVVGTPAVCPNGGGDCLDTSGTVNPGIQEICANGKDDNCNGLFDEENASGCTNFWTDLDLDAYGGGAPKCLCQASATHKATKGGDCNDGNNKVNPNMLEICGNGLDDDCSGTQNDVNAQGCKDFYTDSDKDAWGTLPKKCLCTGAGATTATKPGDCNDANKLINPDLAETCNNADDNCNNVIDEGCDDDKDGYCDNGLNYTPIGGTQSVCGQAVEGATVTLKCDAGMTITSVDFASYGTPSGGCGTYTTSSCHASTSLQKVKDLCLGKATCDVAATNGTFGDPCGGTVKMLDVQVTCTGADGLAPDICPKGAGDTDDTDPAINPEGKEICDGKDNDSDFLVDEGCDDDKDGYCDKEMIVVGAPASCPKGSGDCNDDALLVNPGLSENCATAFDDNCNGEINEINALNCTIFFSDSDKDQYGTKSFQCMCAPIGVFSAKKTADCNDNNPDIYPGRAENCDNADNNCNGVIDEDCDDDKDGYCDAKLIMMGGGADVCPNGDKDCNDLNPDVNPSKAEICNDGLDNNCDGQQNDPGAQGCTTFYSDLDKDGFGSSISKCLCGATGTFTSANKSDCFDGNAEINPLATEICDGLDNDCDAQIDEGCDDDGDDWCDAGMKTIGKPDACMFGGGDCNDDDKNANPGIAAEACDDKDDDCDGVIDDGCDDDKDGYCDASVPTSNPLPKICPKGAGDCDDYNFDQNPGAQEICGNGIDDNCNLSQNDIDAANCKKFFFDGDEDGAGLNASLCLCQAAGSYTAPLGDDCDDEDAAIKPGAAEICGDGKDNNCNLTQNDEGAQGCTDFFFDADKDGFGLTALKKCQCFAEGSHTADKGGDCNDVSAAVNPGKAELCNDVDDNCEGKVDEGCNDDGDAYCDAKMTTVGLPNACALGGGDCDDENTKVNPGHPEICDGLDNNCVNAVDEGCDDDDDNYCDAAMVTVGTPPTCLAGGGDCNDNAIAINPGAPELCSTPVDDNCNGTANDVGANGCSNFGLDQDGDIYYDKNVPAKCMCTAEGQYTGTKPNDCNDKNNLVNPAVIELCDGVDNNCDGVIDENCDKDKDGYCDAGRVTIGKPYTCPKGGGDCDDNVVGINPGVAEVCGNTVDENCNNDTNDIGAQGCKAFYLDGDGDGWAVNVSQCLCVPANGYKLDVSKVGDCDDTTVAVNPAAKEVCGDNLDNNCNGNQNEVNATGCVNFYKDGDKDGYGAGAGQCQCFAQGTFVTPNPGDCDDANAKKNPGEVEACDDLDNNCAGGVDEGCDDDADDYCNADLVTATPFPAACPKGGKDCNDKNDKINPAQVEVCDDVDTDCDGTIDDGCDDDKDGYCDKALQMLGTPAICTAGGNDCDDSNALINPLKTEICDDLDNNCTGIVDEGCDDDGDKWCDIGMSVVGKPAKCVNGPGDCVDTNAAVSPGAPEVCDGIDNNCAGGVDETCKDSDGDGYCVGSVPVSPACPKGGNDCNDSNALVNPGATETCSTQGDDNCDGVSNAVGALGCKNWYLDNDGDAYGTGAPVCKCVQEGKVTALAGGDCDDANAKLNPNVPEICDGLDNDCKNGADDGCDNDGDGWCDTAMLMASTAQCVKSPKPAVGQTQAGDDCVDTSAASYPGGPEVCNDLDDNCNGDVDEGCDDDNDNYCEKNMTLVGTPSTCTAGGGDCDDVDETIKPGAQENCGTPYDDNCDGLLTGLNAKGCTNFYFDGDNDGWGTSAFECQCAPNGNYKASKSGDCNDANASMFPNASAEICDNLDNNCNGVVDEGCDEDKDGYCGSTLTVTSTVACPKTVVQFNKGDDCDPTNKVINPGATEICDGQDNNCNGVVDEGCDDDNDNYCDKNMIVVGAPPTCTAGGGDCADNDAAVKPSSTEVCNGKDDNCNAIVDEAGASGCSAWYYDGDQDGVGVNSSQCLCAASGLYSSKQNNDCNDNCPTCKPGGTEMCDAGDNDCDGLVDEGCNGDGDAYCTASMVTVGTPPICTKGGGDCNDGNGSIYPTKVETCNNVDDNCNGQIDENASDQCTQWANATVGCVAGSCVIKSCLANFYNLNGSSSDGCECNGTDQYEPNNSCGAAYTVSSSVSDSGGGAKETIAARLVDSSDEDWYRFYASDTSDSGTGVCDRYNVRVVFTNNPGGLAFEVTRGGCPNGANTVCCGHTDFNWFTNFKGASNGDPSRQWSEYGECPCQSGDSFAQSHAGWNLSPSYGGPYCKDFNANGVCFPRGFWYTKCADNSAWYYVRVYKASGGPVCSSYKLEISNGVYGQPGTGNGYK